jgi:MFS transporter, DHA2 family, multidrug resistance protein
MDRSGGHRTALPALLNGPHRAVPGRAVSVSGPRAERLAAVVDHRHLRVPAGGVPDTNGTLGDRIGRRRLLLIGAAAFGLMSVAAAFSTSTEMLIASER